MPRKNYLVFDEEFRIATVEQDKGLMRLLKRRNLTAKDFVKLERKKPGAMKRAYRKGVEFYLDDLEGKTKKKEMSAGLRKLLEE